MKKNKLIICPNEEKLNILKDLENNKSLHNYKFMTKKEFLNNYYFSYDENALYYLMKKYNYNIDVCKVYLKNLYVIDINKSYKDEKLSLLKNIKEELIKNNLLTFHNDFKKYLTNFEIEVKNYYDLDLYEENALNYKLTIPKTSLNSKVYEFKTMEDEINYVCIKIIELIKSGININKISLVNVSDDYLYTINKMFNYYNIPININMNNSIYGTKVVSSYLEKNELDLTNSDNSKINKKIINILESISNLEDDEIKNIILIDKLKNTYINPNKYDNAVNIKDLFKNTFREDEYIFLIGFNQDILPNMRKDIEYINDSLKDEIDMYKTDYLNKREKEIVTYLLSKISNLYLSYKLESPFNKFYKSSLINDLELEVIKYNPNNYNYSNIYNKILLAEDLDLFNLYNEVSPKLKLLNTHYNIDYNSYSNHFTGINNDSYLENIDYPLKLSYTSLNSYNECKFKYYIKYVLKLDEYEDSFASFIGSLFHEILTLYKKNNFNLDLLYNEYLSKRELTLKERLLLVRIKRELEKLIEVINNQNKLTNYNEEFYEKKIEVDLDKKISVKFIGYIDKIMFRKEIEDTYFSIIDYKTGKIDTNIEPIKYGLHMQLPVYLYLINFSKTITNPIFTGIYYQNILFDYPTYSINLDKELKERYLLKGYSTDNIEVLEKFDKTFENSQLIKSMNCSKDNNFSRFTKILNNDDLYNLVTYTKNHIDKKTDEIIEGDFKINPKVYGMKNISCNYCNFNDLCFMRDKDLVYLDKVDDLSFLGGEE